MPKLNTDECAWLLTKRKTKPWTASKAIEMFREEFECEQSDVTIRNKWCTRTSKRKHARTHAPSHTHACPIATQEFIFAHARCDSAPQSVGRGQSAMD